MRTSNWIVASLFLVAGASSALPGATFVVTNRSDSGPGTLRQAILDANAGAAGGLIELRLDGAPPWRIQPASPLPDLQGPVVLDGTTQTGFSGRPLVELRGDLAGASDGLRLAGGYCTVQGLAISRFQRAGLRLLGGTNVIRGNFIGTDLSGKLSVGNGEAGVDMFLGGGGNRIGGGGPGDRNVICGNRWGLYVVASDNIIQGNYVGLEVDGLLALGNLSGITLVRSSRNLIGGGAPGEQNLIAGNLGNGLELLGGAVDGPSANRIQGNFIGINAAGGALGNAQGLVLGANASGNQIGGTNFAERNVISGNLGSGLLLSGAGSSNRILGNYIGVDPTGASGIPNRQHGIRIAGGQADVGGDDPAAGNVIASNGLAGVSVEAGAGNSIRGNRIFGNGTLGIDLGADQATPNDPDDADDGANQLQNFPELASSSAVGNRITIQGSLQSRPQRAYVLEFFVSPACDPSGFGEGFLFLGRTNVLTSTNGAAGFEIVLSNAAPLGWSVTATATDDVGNTSEFSPCLPLLDSPLVVPVFRQSPLSQSAVVNGSVTFSAAISGEPPPFEYELRRGSTALATNRSSDLAVFFTLTNLQPVQAGLYRVFARNAATSGPGVGSDVATLTVLADADGDGMPDAFEAAHGLATNNAADAAQDTDGDGASNLDEFNAGTSPTNALSSLRLLIAAPPAPAATVLLTFNAVSNKTYRLQTGDTPVGSAWSNLLRWVARPTNTSVSVTDLLGVSRGYYRVVSP